MRARRVADLPLEIEALLMPDNLSGYEGETGVAAAACCWSCGATGITDFGLLGDREADRGFSEALLDDLLALWLSVGVLLCFRDGEAPLVSELPNMGIGTTGSVATADGCDAKSNIDRSSAGKKSCSMSAGSRIAATSTKSSS